MTSVTTQRSKRGTSDVILEGSARKIEFSTFGSGVGLWSTKTHKQVDGVRWKPIGKVSGGPH